MNDSTSQDDHLLDAAIGEQVGRLTAALTMGSDALDPDRVVSATALAVPAAEHGGLTLLPDGRPPLLLAAGDDVPRKADRLQHASQEGPFHEPTTAHGVVLVDDLATDPRWPVFGQRVTHELGVRSLLSLRMAVGGADRAALVLYAAQPGAFDESDVRAASLCAPFAALAAQARLRAHDVDNLTAALETSRQIGTAIGIVMARQHTSSAEAFTLLRRASMDLNRKVHHIAVEVEMTGDLPSHGTWVRDRESDLDRA